MADLNHVAGTPDSVPATADDLAITTLLHIIDALTARVQQLKNPLASGPVALAPTTLTALSACPALPVVPAGIQTQGPWVVGTMYNVVPTEPLVAMPAAQSALFSPETIWYAVTRGHYVGITTTNAVAVAAVTGASRSSMGGHPSEAMAIAAFNETLALNMVSIV